MTSSLSSIKIWIPPEKWDLLTEGKPIYRGTSYTFDNEIVYIGSPQDRTPVSMPKDVQKKIDDCFEERFSIRFRQNSLFATSNLEVARGYAGAYGEIRILRPLAPFCYCWSPQSKDLYFEYMESLHTESIEDMIARLNFEIDDIASAIYLEHEIMLVGEKFEAKIFK